MRQKVCIFLAFFSALSAGRLPTIVSSDSEKILEYIDAFPYSDYQVVRVPCYGYTGYYYVDSIDDCIKNILRTGASWEDHISLLLTQYARRGSTVLDIGAHIGTHTQTLAHVVGPEGSVLAFEPQPKIFRELVQNIKLNELENVTCYWKAVGSEEGKIELSNICLYNEGGTSLINQDFSSDSWCYTACGGAGVSVDLLSIDSLNLNDVSLIKIDVEKMENAVLDGACETILRNKPVILLEILGGTHPDYATPKLRKQIEYTKKKLENLGYTVYHLDWYLWDYLALPD